MCVRSPKQAGPRPPRQVGRRVKASNDEPQYLVKSDRSGTEAVYRPAAPHKKEK